MSDTTSDTLEFSPVWRADTRDGSSAIETAAGMYLHGLSQALPAVSRRIGATITWLTICGDATAEAHMDLRVQDIPAAAGWFTLWDYMSETPEHKVDPDPQAVIDAMDRVRYRGMAEVADFLRRELARDGFATDARAVLDDYDRNDRWYAGSARARSADAMIDLYRVAMKVGVPAGRFHICERVGGDLKAKCQNRQVPGDLPVVRDLNDGEN